MNISQERESRLGFQKIIFLTRMLGNLVQVPRKKKRNQHEKKRDTQRDTRARMEGQTTDSPPRVLTSQTVWHVTPDKRYRPMCERPLPLVASAARVSLYDEPEKEDDSRTDVCCPPSERRPRADRGRALPAGLQPLDVW